MSDVLLILVPTPNLMSRDLPDFAGVMPLGLAYMGAVLLENGFSVRALDLFNCPGAGGDLIEILRNERPGIVGLSATTENFPNAVRIARIAKKVIPTLKVVIGGPHATFTADETLGEPAIDVVVHREGELTMLELAYYLLRGTGSLRRIRGISFRGANGLPSHNPPRKLIGNLDELPFPSRDLFDKAHYATRHQPVITSRGCPQQCIFCAASAMSGGHYRMRSASHVVDELAYLCRLGNPKINFSDDTITGDVSRLNEVFELLSPLKLHLDWICESRVDVVDAGTLAKMHRMGCSIIFFGIESGCQEVLDRIRKRITVEQIHDAVRLAHDEGLWVICSFMIGHPNDTEDTIRRTVEFGVLLERTFAAEIRFHVCTPFPGTPLYRRAAALGLRLLTRDYAQYNYFSPVFDTVFLSQERIRALFFDANQQVIRNLPRHVALNYASLADGVGPEQKGQ